MNDDPDTYGGRFEEIYQEVERLADNSEEFDYFESSLVAEPASEFADGERVIEELESDEVIDQMEAFDPESRSSLGHLEAEKEISREGNSVDAKVVISMRDITSYDRKSIQSSSDPTDYMGMSATTETVSDPESLPESRSRLRGVDMDENSEMKLTLEYGKEF